MEVASGQQKLERRPSNARDVIVAIALPWLIFFLVLCMFLFTFHDLAPIVWTLIVLCLGLALLFFVLGMSVKHKIFVAIGLLSFASTAVATTVGLWLSDAYLERYYKLEDSDFANVDAETPPPSGQDTSLFQFGSQTFVDDKRTIGYVAGGEIYCIAPVSSPKSFDATVQYWATGQNCCEMRSNFDCGSSREGSFIAVTTDANSQENEIFDKAIDVAKAVYGMKTSNSSRLVDFVVSVESVKDDLWDEALSVALVASIMDLLMCVVAGLMLYKVLSMSKPAAGSRISA